ncbi:MAG TPA: hypothetical protein ENI23_17070 [bacterium]|nr:hypothetical protein [bacterium]
MNEDLKKDAMENIKNTLKGCDNESTRAPYWMIVDASPFGISDEVEEYENDDGDIVEVEVARPSIHEIASRITGPFFSRKDAQEYLDRKHYNFSDEAKVYCHSGWESGKYLALCEELKL